MMRPRRSRKTTSGGTIPLFRRRVSESTIHRLSVYYRTLVALEAEGYYTVNSQELADREKLTPAQVRKDLSSFGSFGTRGLGYPASELKGRIAKILGIDHEWNVGLIGVGHLGSALVSYKEFQKQGFIIRALFDNDQRKIGSNHKGIVIADIRDLASEVRKRKLSIMIIAVPSANAQAICDLVVAAGIKSILNFAPVSLRVPPDVIVRAENMAIELEFLSFHLAHRQVRTAALT
ncbi:MAG: redox-sensing transcriptional repressor Rex [Candidatus Zixiibacteriota bacterium]